MKSIKMILLSVLLLSVVSFSSAEDQCGRYCNCYKTFFASDGINITGPNCSDMWNGTNALCTPSCWIGANNCTSQNGGLFTNANITANFNEQICCGALNNSTTWGCVNCDSTRMYFMCSGEESDTSTLISEPKTWFTYQLCRENNTLLHNISDPHWIGLQLNNSSEWFQGGYSKHNNLSTAGECTSYMTRSLYKTNKNEYAFFCNKIPIHISRYNTSWEDAMDYCEQEAFGPLVIQSEDDRMEMELELRRRSIMGPVWVGLRQSRLFGFWIWTNGVDVGTWTNWTGGTAPEYQMSQYCGALVKVDDQYKLTDRDCQSKFKVLCENKSYQNYSFQYDENSS